MNPVVVNGNASFSQTANVLTVTNSNGAIINWDKFSIKAGETTHFAQTAASSTVLNRVLSDPTAIYGTLSSNGRVWLVNPAGIMVGPGGRVDTAGFVASTLNLRNEDFLAGRKLFENTPGAGNVINQGEIRTPAGGSVYLIGSDVSNQGIITTPQGATILAAGATVSLIDSATPGVKVDITGAAGNATNLGEITAEAGRVGIAGVIVRNSGQINASSVVSDGGRVFLRASQDAYVDKAGRIVTTGTKGGRVEVLGQRVVVADSASIDASGVTEGGKILVGGDFQGKNPEIQNANIAYVGPEARLTADATKVGAGGTVIVWADDTTRAYGNISARGGAEGGDGGLVETSGKRYLDFRASVDTRAPQGRNGTLLLDPSSIDIYAGSGVDSYGGGSLSGSPLLLGGGTSGATIYGATIYNALLTSELVLTTTTGGTGDITIHPGEYSAATNNTNALTLLAYGGGSSNGGVSVSNARINLYGGDLNIVAGWDGNTNVLSGATPVVIAGAGKGNVTVSDAALTAYGMYVMASGNMTLSATTYGATFHSTGAGTGTGAGTMNIQAASLSLYGGAGYGMNPFQPVYGGSGVWLGSDGAQSIQVSGGIHLQAGTADNPAATAFAFDEPGYGSSVGIESGGNQTISANSITLLAGASGHNNSAIIMGRGNQQTISANSVTLTAGSGGHDNAAMIDGWYYQNVTVGSSATAGSLAITGSGGSGSYNNLAVLAGSANPGSGNNQSAWYGGAQTITMYGGSMTLQGGGGTGTLGSCEYVGCTVNGNNGALLANWGQYGQNILFHAVGGIRSNVVLTGGSTGIGNGAAIVNDPPKGTGAQIIRGATASDNPNIALYGGAAGGAYDGSHFNSELGVTQPNYRPNQASIESYALWNGNLGSQTIYGASIYLKGGNATTDASQNGLTPALIVAGTQTIEAQGNLTLQGGSGAAYGGVGAVWPERMGGGAMIGLEGPTNLNLTVYGNLAISAGAGSNGSVGIGSIRGTGIAKMNVSGDASIIADAGSVFMGSLAAAGYGGAEVMLLAGGNVTIAGSSTGGSVRIGSDNDSALHAEVGIAAGKNLTITGNGGGVQLGVKNPSGTQTGNIDLWAGSTYNPITDVLSASGQSGNLVASNNVHLNVGAYGGGSGTWVSLGSYGGDTTLKDAVSVFAGTGIKVQTSGNLVLGDSLASHGGTGLWTPYGTMNISATDISVYGATAANAYGGAQPNLFGNSYGGFGVRAEAGSGQTVSASGNLIMEAGRVDNGTPGFEHYGAAVSFISKSAQTVSARSITLRAGASGHDNAAVLEAYGSQAITLTGSGDVFVMEGGGGANGYNNLAVIHQKNSTYGQTISLTGAGASMVLRGGTGAGLLGEMESDCVSAGMGVACQSSGNSARIKNNGAGGQTINYAYGGGTLAMYGGNTGYDNSAELDNSNDNGTVGSQQILGNPNITIQGGTSGGKLAMYGGSPGAKVFVQGNQAGIFADNAQTINAASLTLTGGSGAASFSPAIILARTQNINVTGAITLQGGSGAAASVSYGGSFAPGAPWGQMATGALIGNADDSATAISSINIKGGSISAYGGAGTSGAAMIGSLAYGATINLGAYGDIVLRGNVGQVSVGSAAAVAPLSYGGVNVTMGAGNDILIDALGAGQVGIGASNILGTDAASVTLSAGRHLAVNSTGSGPVVIGTATATTPVSLVSGAASNPVMGGANSGSGGNMTVGANTTISAYGSNSSLSAYGGAFYGGAFYGGNISVVGNSSVHADGIAVLTSGADLDMTYQVSAGSVSLNSGGRITQTAPINVTNPAGTTTIGATGDITLSNVGNTLGAITVNPATATVSADLYNNSANASLAVAAPMKDLTVRTGGSLSLTGTITAASATLYGGSFSGNAAINAGTFTLNSGTWNQVSATLPGFAVSDFRINGGTFIRALGGNGAGATPYQLTDIYGVQGMGSAGMLGNSFVLANNIDASGTSGWNGGTGFSPVGNSASRFTGIFDGLGNVISNLFINRPGQDNVGLIGFAGSGNILRNVGLLGGSVTGHDRVGELAGTSDAGTLSGVWATGTVIGNNIIGGLLGHNNYGTIGNAYAKGNVTGNSEVGGLAGVNYGNVSNVYTTGNVIGNDSVGGLVGYNNNFGHINYAYATGNISGVTNTGALVGYTYSGGTVANSYWNTATSGVAIPVGLDNGSTTASGGLSPAQMMTGASFVGWDIAGAGASSAVWRIYEGNTYPLLRSFLTPLTVTATSGTRIYDATTAALGSSYSATPDGTKLFGTLTATAASKNVGSNAITVAGQYSDQRGYDINYVAGTLAITQATIGAVTGITANNKVYDSTPAATLNGAGAGFAGMYGGDALTVASASGLFVDKNVGAGKTVNISAITLGGADAGNYLLASNTASTAADITPATISAVTGITAGNKVYDSTQAATLNSAGAGFTGMYGGDVLTVASASGLFADKNVANGKTVNISAITLGGSDLGNYILASDTAATTANITPATISTVTGITANNKVYDSMPAATLNSAGAGFAGMYGGDALTVASASGLFVDKNVGTGKTVNISAIALGGTDAGNYTLASNTAATTADITPATISAVTGITASNKVYDSTQAATLNSAGAGFTGMYGGDVLTVASASGLFADKNVANGKTVNISAITLGGSDLGNYILASDTATTTANITPATISTVTGITASNKVYDSTPTATLNSGSAAFTGMYGGDVLSVASASGTFNNKNVGTGKPVNISGITLGGADAGNYLLANATGSTSADITPFDLIVSGATAVSKVYDGTTAAAITGGVANSFAGDSVSLTGGGSFDDRHVGTGKPVTANLAISGLDSGNYTLTQPVGLTADISQRSSLNWSGSSGDGLWSNPANWTSGIMPDGGNVAAVNLGSANVTFDGGNASANFIGSASVAISTTGTFTISGGYLAAQSLLSTPSFSLTGGHYFSTYGLTVSGNFSQSAGALAVSGPFSVTQASGNLSITNGAPLALAAVTVNNGNFTLTNIGGIATGASPISVYGSVAMTAHSPISIGSGGIVAGNGVTLSAPTASDGSTVNVGGNIVGGSGPVALNSYGTITQNANISGSSISMTSTGGDITLSSGVTNTVAGGSISLTTLSPSGSIASSSSNFVGATPVIDDGAVKAAATTNSASAATSVQTLDTAVTNTESSLSDSTTTSAPPPPAPPPTTTTTGAPPPLPEGQTLGGTTGTFGGESTTGTTGTAATGTTGTIGTPDTSGSLAAVASSATADGTTASSTTGTTSTTSTTSTTTDTTGSTATGSAGSATGETNGGSTGSATQAKADDKPATETKKEEGSSKPAAASKEEKKEAKTEEKKEDKKEEKKDEKKDEKEKKDKKKSDDAKEEKKDEKPAQKKVAQCS